MNSDKKEGTKEAGHCPSPVAKTPFLAEILPGRRLVEFNVALENVPGALEAVASTMRTHNVNVLSGFHNTERWSFFADITDANAPPDKLLSEVNSLGIVTSVHAADGSDFLIDFFHFPFLWEGQRMVIMRAELLSAILDQVREIFRSVGTVSKLLVFDMGKAAGHSMSKIVTEKAGSSDLSIPFSGLMNVYSALGWGIFKLTAIDPERSVARVRVGENFECLFHKGDHGSCYSEFVRGHLAALFSDLFRKDVTAVESECLARGDQFCVFNLQPKHP